MEDLCQGLSASQGGGAWDQDDRRLDSKHRRHHGSPRGKRGYDLSEATEEVKAGPKASAMPWSAMTFMRVGEDRDEGHETELGSYQKPGLREQLGGGGSFMRRAGSAQS